MNIGSNSYDYPLNRATDYVQRDVTVGAPDGAKARLLYGDVNDTLVPSASRLNSSVALTAEGEWDAALRRKGSSGKYTLAKENYDDQAALVIPRAVAYSAGFIDHLFRGRMEIAPPLSGVYAVIDHSVLSRSGQGFSKLILRLRNATAPILPTGTTESLKQDMTAGRILVIARYRENLCYRPDLSEEWALPDRASQAACRGPVEKISTSVHVLNSSGIEATYTPVALGSTSLEQFSVEFDHPIPVDSVDLRLQVVYRGMLGSESDAVVIATKDLPEPTFVAVNNVTDYLVCVNGSVLYKDPSGALTADIIGKLLNIGVPQSALAAIPYTSVRFLFLAPGTNDEPVAVAERAIGLAPGQFSRIGVLAESGTRMSYETGGFGISTLAGFSQPANQSPDDEVSTYRHQQVETLRKTFAHNPRFSYRYAGGDCRAELANFLPGNELSNPAYASYPTPSLQGVELPALYR